MFPLACGNAFVEAARHEPLVAAVGDLAPVGVVVTTVALYLLRRRSSVTAHRPLLLILGALVGVLVGSLSQLPFRVSGLGLSAVPLLLLAHLWLQADARVSQARKILRHVRTRRWIKRRTRSARSDSARLVGASKES
jgi:hypothetical protein